MLQQLQQQQQLPNMKSRGIQLNDSANTGTIFDLKVEVVRDASYQITNGLVVGNILQQNQALILVTQQGELKEHPDLGVGFGDVLLESELLPYRHKIREHFEKDGLSIQTLELYQLNNLKLEASYE